jgi:hypothetical protein
MAIPGKLAVRRGKGRDKLRLDASLESIARAFGDPALRRRAEKLLQTIPDDRLIEALDGGEAAAARVLLRKRGPSAIPLLVALLHRGTGAELALDLLFELSSTPGLVASKAWPLMSTSARLVAVERLPDLAAAATRDADERVRRVGVRILLRRGVWDPDWVSYVHLRPGTDGWTESDRRLIVNRLRKENAVEALASLADTDDGVVLRDVAFGLADAGDARAIFPLLRALRESPGPRRDAEKRLKGFPETGEIDFALAALRHRRESVRLWSACALEGVEDPRAIEPLLRLLDDSSAPCRQAAVRSLGPFAADPRVTERLIGCLDLGDLSVGRAAIEALAKAKAVAAVPALLRALDNGFLRPKARAALKAMI